MANGFITRIGYESVFKASVKIFIFGKQTKLTIEGGDQIWNMIIFVRILFLNFKRSELMFIIKSENYFIAVRVVRVRSTRHMYINDENNTQINVNVIPLGGFNEFRKE